MGSYTNIINSDVEIIDKEGLEDFLEKARNGGYEAYKDPGAQQYARAVKIDADGKLDFYGLDGWKIISYWYPDFVMLLRDVAVFVEGGVQLEYESNEEGGQISFENGECIISAGIMEWKDYSPEQMRSKLPPLNKELTKRLVARRL